jgi:hypothetical protein
LTENPRHLSLQKIEEKKRLEEEIQKAGAILEEKNIDIRNTEEYKKFKDELKKYGLSIENPRRFASILHAIDQIGYIPRQIVRELAGIKSLRRTERLLKNNCKMWESRATRYKELVPMCEQVVSSGIGLPLLVALQAAVIKRIEQDGVPAGAAPFRVMQDIEYYNRHGGMNKQLNDTTSKIQVMNLISARQNDTIMALARLQVQGITENQILKMCRMIEADGHNFKGEESLNSETFPVF